jgi:hypothetical protein
LLLQVVVLVERQALVTTHKAVAVLVVTVLLLDLLVVVHLRNPSFL